MGFMGKKTGPKGLVPYRNKPKNGHQKRMETVPPTPELLRQKAVAQGRTVRKARHDLALEPLELLHDQGRISNRQLRAAYKFGALRRSTFGKGNPDGGQSVLIHEHLSSEDAPDRAFTDEEIAEKRERDEFEYSQAVGMLKCMGRREFEAVQYLVIDRVELSWTYLVKAKRGLSALAEMWNICEED